MANPFVHIELNTQDIGAAKKFYAALFNWELKDVDMGPAGTYTTIGVVEGTGGGMMQHPKTGEPSQWISYVLVRDLTASTNLAKSLGAKIIKENETVSNKGKYSIFIDPTGATLALWEVNK